MIALKILNNLSCSAPGSRTRLKLWQAYFQSPLAEVTHSLRVVTSGAQGFHDVVVSVPNLYINRAFPMHGYIIDPNVLDGTVLTKQPARHQLRANRTPGYQL